MNEQSQGITHDVFLSRSLDRLLPIIGLLINLHLWSSSSEKHDRPQLPACVRACIRCLVLLAYSLTQHPDFVHWRLADGSYRNLQRDWTFRVDTLSTTRCWWSSGVNSVTSTPSDICTRTCAQIGPQSASAASCFSPVHRAMMISGVRLILDGSSWVWEAVDFARSC